MPSWVRCSFPSRRRRPAALAAARVAPQAQEVEKFGAEGKLAKLRDLLHQEGFFDQPDKQLLIFTEFRDTLN